ETEHLLKAILEQKNGLARRIFSKDSVDNTQLLEATDEFIQRQPKIDKEYMSSHFVTNENNLSSVKEIFPLLEKSTQLSVSLLIFTKDISMSMHSRYTQGTLKAAVVKCPGVGERNKALLILPS
ncbi:chaperonin 60 subunit alpha 2, chloroplastic-like protein, partial [Tanacetum coccineum]